MGKRKEPPSRTTPFPAVWKKGQKPIMEGVVYGVDVSGVAHIRETPQQALTATVKSNQELELECENE